MLKSWFFFLMLFAGIPLLLITAEGTQADTANSPPAQAQDQDEEGEAIRPQDDTMTADHSEFPALQGPFETAQDVTDACLSCHTEAAQQIMDTTHWTWEYDSSELEEPLGKRNVINNFCISTITNEARCTSCHTGYGWDAEGFDFTEESNVDCIVCHDNTGTYKKFPTAAGHPTYEETQFSGRTWEPPDLANIAQNVGAPTRQTCGSCHFSGGGGDAVKHGDLDSTLLEPSEALDVHMSPDGLDFECQVCHSAQNHQISGSRYEPSIADTSGVDVPGYHDGNQATCESCHALDVHEDDRLNQHVDTIACETCHVPEYGREQPIKMSWDWSQAGEKDEDGNVQVIMNDLGVNTYHTKKGEFSWAQNIEPEYIWTTGRGDFTTVGDQVNLTQNGIFEVTAGTLSNWPPDFWDSVEEEGVHELNPIECCANEEDARIWPVRVFYGRQPYDPENNTLIVPHLFPSGPDDDSAYWKFYDWQAAAETGMEAAGADFSGEVAFTNTVMYWPITHMVAPAEEALSCQSCHARDGRLDRIEDIYIPGRDTDPVHNWLAIIAIGGAAVGIVVHGTARLTINRRKKRR